MDFSKKAKLDPTRNPPGGTIPLVCRTAASKAKGAEMTTELNALQFPMYFSPTVG